MFGNRFKNAKKKIIPPAESAYKCISGRNDAYPVEIDV
jgi:hypothetical protein